jgi:hypothetical protein
MYVTDILVPEQCHTLVVVGFLFTCLASVFVILRVITRVWFVRSVGIDDGFIVLSNVCLHQALSFLPLTHSAWHFGISGCCNGAYVLSQSNTIPTKILICSRGSIWPWTASRSKTALAVHPSHNRQRHILHSMPSRRQAVYLVSMPTHFYNADRAQSLHRPDCVLFSLWNFVSHVDHLHLLPRGKILG